MMSGDYVNYPVVQSTQNSSNQTSKSVICQLSKTFWNKKNVIRYCLSWTTNNLRVLFNVFELF